MTINKRQIFIGIVILLTGTLVYIADRPIESTLFMSAFCPAISLYGKIPSIFGVFGNNLPALFHVFAFSLLTSGFVKAQKTTYLKICFFWVFINSLFELGQKFNSFANTMIPSGNIQSFFLNGTFDYLDIYAFIAGGILAYTFLRFTGNKESQYEKL